MHYSSPWGGRITEQFSPARQRFLEYLGTDRAASHWMLNVGSVDTALRVNIKLSKFVLFFVDNPLTLNLV